MATVNKILTILSNTIFGWIVGLITTLGLAYLWLHVLPVEDRTGQGSTLWAVIIYLLMRVSPFAIIGGLIGGLIPKEGNRTDQLFYAALISFFLSTPVALFLFWYTGF